MIRDTREIIVGAFVVAGLALMLGASYKVRELTAQAATDDYQVTATFNQVDGLFVGDDVQLGGIRLGVVESMTLDANYRAGVVMRLDGAIKLPLDTSAAIHTDGLFGSKYVVLEPGGEEEILQNGDQITFTQDAVIVSELLELIIGQGRARQNKKDRAGGGKTE
jgi:phospholipid/cholesterol/gamma-HCH transport system substrate-binding protein